MTSQRIEIGTIVRAVAGWYEIQSEETIDVDGQPVAYVIGRAVMDSACCGSWGCRFAIVIGFVKSRPAHGEESELYGLEPVPVSGEKWRRRVSKVIAMAEDVEQIQFMT
jgi:hypothetical protein